MLSIQNLQKLNSDLEKLNFDLETSISNLQKLNLDLENSNSNLQKLNLDLENSNSNLQEINSDKDKTIIMILNSKSWKITRPLRKIYRILKKSTALIKKIKKWTRKRLLKK